MSEEYKSEYLTIRASNAAGWSEKPSALLTSKILVKRPDFLLCFFLVSCSGREIFCKPRKYINAH